MHRRAEVGHIQPALQFRGNSGVVEIDNDLAGLLADIDADTGIGQANDDFAIALRAAAEIDAL